MYSTQSDSYREPSRARDRQKPRASAASVSAEQRITFALATYAQHARQINKRKHHALRERPDRLSRRAPASEHAFADITVPRTRVNDAPVVFAHTDNLDPFDPQVIARQNATDLAQHRTECERKRRAASRQK